MSQLDTVGLWAFLFAIVWRVPNILSVWMALYVDRQERRERRHERDRQEAMLAPQQPARILKMEEPEWQRPS